MSDVKHQDESLKAKGSRSISNIVENISDISQKAKQCAGSFKMTEARWGLCRSTFVFFMGVVLTVQLRTVVHELLS